MTTPTPTQERLALDRERHRRLLGGAEDHYIALAQLDLADLVNRTECEMRLRRLADSFLSDELTKILEGAVARRTHQQVEKIVNQCSISANRWDVAGLILEELGDSPPKLWLEEIDRSVLGRHYVPFVTAALLADEVAGDYSDPRRGRS